MSENKKSWIKVKCHECGNEQTIFSRVSTQVVCSNAKCDAIIAEPTGGKSAIKAEIVELI